MARRLMAQEPVGELKLTDKTEICALTRGMKDLPAKLNLSPKATELFITLMQNSIIEKPVSPVWEKLWVDDDRIFTAVRKSPFIKWETIHSFTFDWAKLIDSLKIKKISVPRWVIDEEPELPTLEPEAQAE